MANEYCIRGGIIFDPAAGFRRNDSLFVADGEIIPAGDERASKAVDIDADGYIITPALVDFHTHIFPRRSLLSVHPDLMAAQGVAACCDAGTCGEAGIEELLAYAELSAIEIKAYINIGSRGQIGDGTDEDLRPESVDIRRIKSLIKSYPESILGLKMRFSRGITGEERAKEILENALALKREIKKPICIHVTDSPLPMSAIAEKLDKGDIICHCFHNVGGSILENGAIPQSILDAKKRGGLFDAANGNSNFCTKTAAKCIESGFYPDIISTDAFLGNFNIRPNCKSLPMLMSKYAALGMPEEDVFKAAVAVPAGLMGIDVSVRPGSPATFAILKRHEKRVRFLDLFNDPLDADMYYGAVMTMRKGRILYCAADFWN